MGKKSRRPNRNTQKDTAAASATTAVAAQAALERDQLLNQTRIFKQLSKSRDWEGLLQLESTVSDAAKNTYPRYYNYLAVAHRQLGREGCIDQAIVCFRKAIERANKGRDEPLQAMTTWDLTCCYVETGRIEEAMDLHKSLVADIGKKRLDLLTP